MTVGQLFCLVPIIFKLVNFYEKQHSIVHNLWGLFECVTCKSVYRVCICRFISIQFLSIFLAPTGALGVTLSVQHKLFCLAQSCLEHSISAKSSQIFMKFSGYLFYPKIFFAKKTFFDLKKLKNEKFFNPPKKIFLT